MKTPYSRDYYPPAPVLPVSLAAIDESPRLGPHLSLVDSGSDGTFAPIALLEELDLPISYMTGVRSHLGERVQRVAVHRVDLIVDGIRLPNMEVVSDDWGDQIILGRNVLNRLLIVMDGLAHMTTVS